MANTFDRNPLDQMKPVCRRALMGLLVFRLLCGLTLLAFLYLAPNKIAFQVVPFLFAALLIQPIAAALIRRRARQKREAEPLQSGASAISN
jgi:biotin transporter BioY